jgi:hypothetical protein
MMVCGGVKISFHAFLTEALDADEWSAARPEFHTNLYIIQAGKQ